MNLKNVFVFLIAGLLASGVYAQKRSLTEQADDAYISQQYVKAVELYKKAYSKVKANRQEKDRILFQTAECYRLIDNKTEAIKTYKRLVTAGYYSAQPKIFLYLADLQRFEADWDNSEANYREYLKLVPNDVLAKQRLASIPMAKQWVNHPTMHQIRNEKAVNTEWNDWGPHFASNEDKNNITFTSSRPSEEQSEKDAWTGQYFSDIYTATKQSDGSLGEPTLLSIEDVNTSVNEGELIMLINGKTNNIYFSRCNVKDKTHQTCAIYMTPIVQSKKGKAKKTTKKATTSKTDNKNTNDNAAKSDSKDDAENSTFVKIDLGDTNYNYLHPAVTSDELTIYFASDRPGGEGDYDLWKATRKSVDEPFGNVQNLGKVINTPGKEEFPILRTDTRLYFSSDGHPGLGGLDLFYSDNVNGQWNEPSNLQYPINSPSDEISIIFNEAESATVATSESGYFASNRAGGIGGDDIYSFYRSPMLFTLTGKVRDDKSMQPIASAKVKLIGDDKSVLETRTDRKGVYAFNAEQVKYNVNYRIQVAQVDYFNTEGTESTVGLTTSKDMIHDFKLIPIPKDPVVLPEIRYDLSRWELKDQYQDSLSDLLIILVNNPNYVIELGSHTDSRPFPTLTNDTLSQRRAESVVDFLHKRGIEFERLVAKGYGDRIPRTLKSTITVEYNKKKFTFPNGVTLTDAYIDSLKTKDEREAAHQLNRRTEFKVLRSDYIPRDVRDSIEDAKLKAPIVNMVNEQKDADMDVPIIYTDNHIRLTMINGKLSQLYIILNGKAIPTIYDERYKDMAVLDWDVAMDLLLQGRINKDDFAAKDKAFDEDGNILDNSVLTFRSAYIGKYWTDRFEVLVRKGMQQKMIINRNGLAQFGHFTFNKQKGEIVFDK
ncbi:MAG: OmpA family protein [Bacteroidales bacterium]|jgi:peptidoglycan-associated lipoprotein|nr:OmpA family protein [Bacteroidales bacterium]